MQLLFCGCEYRNPKQIIVSSLKLLTCENLRSLQACMSLDYSFVAGMNWTRNAVRFHSITITVHEARKQSKELSRRRVQDQIPGNLFIYL